MCVIDFASLSLKLVIIIIGTEELPKDIIVL